MTHICIGNLTIIGSGNGLSPSRHRAIILTNDGILLIGPLGINFSEIIIKFLMFSFKKMRLKVWSVEWRPFCLGLNALTTYTNVWLSVIVARLSKSLATLTLGSSKINQHCWRFHGSGVIAAPQIIGLISFCTGMHHEYFFEVANVLSCSPFMFGNTENKQLDCRIRHSHLASTLFHSLLPWWRPRRIRPQITRLSQLQNSAMGTWPIYKNSIIPDWFEKWRDIKFWYRC